MLHLGSPSRDDRNKGHDEAGRLTHKNRKRLNGQRQNWSYTRNSEDRLTRATTPTGEP
ncbi:hypothetical protein ABZ686_14685 [Streptomyces sp. NPDC006992]|uniref:hypothetical protein n=1 Tax=Streptomyces sp. NPDC006992 TaxID=3155601 RepID=UPI0033C53BFA